MTIADILAYKGHEVVKIRTTDTILAAAQRMAEHRIGALLVQDAWMHQVGIFTERDLLKGVAERGAALLNMTVESRMTAPVITCTPSERVETVLGAMTLAQIRHLPVMDHGKLVGMVSIGDLVKHRLDQKELEANVLLDLSRMRA